MMNLLFSEYTKTETTEILPNRNPWGETMIKKSAIIALSSLALFCTSAYGQGWKNNWRRSQLSANQSESKLGWNRGKWHKSPSYWRNKPYVGRPMASDGWQNRWSKRKWGYSSLNWSYFDLEYDNTVKKYEVRIVIQEVRELVPSEMESEKVSVRREKKEYAKAHIETIPDEAETDSEKAPDDLGHTDNHITVISGNQTFRIEKNVQKTVHMVPGKLTEIYSSKAENP